MGDRAEYRQTDGILIARLHGTANRLSFAGAETAAAVAELRAITDRVDLLSDAAGTHMAAYRKSSTAWPMSRVAADLLLAAGADLALAEVTAQDVARRTAVPPPPGAGPTTGSAYG